MASELPLVIVGAGIAGVCAALAAAPRPVLLLSRGGDDGRDGTAASAMAKGGIAAAVGPADSAASHAGDTVAAGAGHNHAAMVQLLVAAATEAIGWLQWQGCGSIAMGSSCNWGARAAMAWPAWSTPVATGAARW